MLKWTSRARAERIVINTGPLIALARMDALHVPGQLPYQFICPSLDTAEPNLSQIVKCRIVKLRLARWIIGVARRDDDYHTLPGAG